MEFTGERYVPATPGIEDLYLEHMSRYVYASAAALDRHVLDVGCGCGYGAHYLAVHGASGVLGIDPAEEAVRFASEHYRHPVLRFALMDAHRLALREAFDLVTCFEMIEHVEDAEEVLAQMAGVMAEDGLLLVSTPNRAVYRSDRQAPNPFHVREYTRREFEHLLATRFAWFSVLDQQWAEGVAIGAAGTVGGELKASLVSDDGSGSGALALEAEPPYFLAVCAKSVDAADKAQALGSLALVCGSVRYRALKNHLANLEREFDKRGRWAKALDREVRRRDETIKRLQAELAASQGCGDSDRDKVPSADPAV
jgi:SAM-dependent methyltransferase